MLRRLVGVVAVVSVLLVGACSGVQDEQAPPSPSPSPVGKEVCGTSIGGKP